jgi:hypothetical protein
MTDKSSGGGLLRLFASLIIFLVNTTFRIGLNFSLIAAIVLTIHTVGRFSQQALQQRKQVLDLIYWRDPKKSAVVLALTLLALLLLASFSLITVIAYVGLTLLAVTLSYRIYKTILAQVQKTDAANPFKPYLEHDLTLPQDRVHQQVDVLLEHAQCVVSQLRRLFLVEDVFDTVKFGLLLWALTYIGAWFSSLTLIILLVLGVFSVPKFYEVYKEPIDKNLAVVREHVKKVTDVVQDKLPFLKKKQH